MFALSRSYGFGDTSTNNQNQYQNQNQTNYNQPAPVLPATAADAILVLQNFLALVTSIAPVAATYTVGADNASADGVFIDPATSVVVVHGNLLAQLNAAAQLAGGAFVVAAMPTMDPLLTAFNTAKSNSANALQAAGYTSTGGGSSRNNRNNRTTITSNLGPLSSVIMQVNQFLTNLGVTPPDAAELPWTSKEKIAMGVAAGAGVFALGALIFAITRH